MVLRMLKEIGSVANVPDYIKRVKAGEFRLMGFGHRVYKNYDPRARIIKQVAYEVFEVTEKIQELILKRSTSTEIQKAAEAEQGMVTMRQDGYLKALAGLTSINEVNRVAAADSA